MKTFKNEALPIVLLAAKRETFEERSVFVNCDKLKIASTEIHLCAWTVPRDAAKKIIIAKVQCQAYISNKTF